MKLKFLAWSLFVVMTAFMMAYSVNLAGALGNMANAQNELLISQNLQNNSDKQVLAARDQAENTTTLDPAEIIKDALVTKRYGKINPLLNEDVEVLIKGSGCCGQLTRESALIEMDYLVKAELPWNFSSSNPKIIGIKTLNPSQFPPSSIIAISQDDVTAVFSFSEDGKIGKITLSPQHDLLFE